MRVAQIVSLFGALITLTAGDSAAQQPALAPKYLKRLEMPSRTDGFRKPNSVVADLHAGEVFVCDTWNNRIVIFDQLGSYRYLIEGGGAFSTPLDVAVDPEGYIFLLARRGREPRIILLDFDGLYIDDFAVPTLETSDQPPNPTSLAISPSGEQLFVLDRAAHRVWITDRRGTTTGHADLAGELNEEDLLEQLYGHLDVYGDRLLVAVPSAGHVRMFDLQGQPVGHVGRKGTARCQAGFPVAGALDREGNAVVLDKQRMLFTIWRVEDNVCVGEFSGIGQSAGALYAPNDLALDGSGKIYISQTFQGRVQVFDGANPAPVPEPPIADSAEDENGPVRQSDR
jgi:sugar lactone lactonase YvrE